MQFHDDDKDDDNDDCANRDDTLYEGYARFYYDAETNCYYLKPTAAEIQKRTREFFEAHGQLKMEL